MKQKYIDLTVKAVCEFEQSRKRDRFISAKYLYTCGLPKSEDAEQIATTLAAMGLIEYAEFFPNAGKSMRPTAGGKRYYQEMEKRQQEFRHDWKIALFSAVSGALISEPLWAALRWVVEYLQA